MSQPFPPPLVQPGDIPAALDFGQPREHREYLLDGELHSWTGPVQEVRSPLLAAGADGPEHPLLGWCPAQDAETGLKALDAALHAYGDGLGAWPLAAPAERIARVEDFARRMAAKKDEIVRLMVWEICKPLPECEQEFARTLENIRDTVDALKTSLRASATAQEDAGIAAQVRRSPLGVVLCMGPFNFPLNETLATLIPALVMGNTAVVKLPKIGRLLFFPLLDCFREAFPAGVVNIVSGGVETVAPLMSTGKVSVLAFIGTSRAAEAMRGLHPKPQRLRSVLGLEAKNAAIVLDDADLDTAVSQVLRGAFGFNGQRCTALKLVFVQRGIAQKFLEQLGAAASALKIGAPWEPGVNITPLPEPGKVAFLDALVKDALGKGAHIVNTSGGKHDATTFAPTVLYPVTPDMRVFAEEQFGPLCPVAVFDEVAEPLRAIAASDYGQQASVFGGDPDVLGPLVDSLVNLVSRVNLNCKCQRGPDTLPFTARKDSAVGTLSARDALDAFSLSTLVAVRCGEAKAFDALRQRGLSRYLSTDL